MIIGIDASRANVSQRTGTERYAWEVIRRLIFDFGNHEVRLYVREPLLPEWPDLPKNVNVRVLHWAPGLLWSHLRLSWELLVHPPDLLFVPADTVPLIHPRRTVTTIHDIAFERFPELYRGVSVQRKIGWLRPFIHALVRVLTLGRYSASERDYHRWSVRQAVRACPTILTVSEFSKHEIVEALDVSPQRITVIPLGVDQPEVFQTISESERRSILASLGIHQPFLLFTGRLERKKNIGMLIQAFLEYVRASSQPCDLVLVGTPGYGWDEVRLEQVQPAVRQRIHILGWQPERTVNVLRTTAVSMILISQYEGFGLPVLEAMSAGTPVICSRHGSLPEVAGQAALYVDSDNLESVVIALRKISEDTQVRNNLEKAGLQRARMYTWDKTAQQTLKALNAALAV